MSSFPQSKAGEDRLEGLLDRINRIASGDASEDEPLEATASHDDPSDDADALGTPSVGAEGHTSSGEFVPPEPKSYREAGLSDTQVEELMLKYLLARGDAQGRQIADQLRLPFSLIDKTLRQLKFEQLVVYRDAAEVNDYQYQLTENGRERARRYSNDCSYYGSAPITLKDYIKSVKAQSIQGKHPTLADLKVAFSDLLINPKMLTRLGPAINSGRGMFLFGYPGNGKTSIAERVTKCFGDNIWIPRALGIEGEIVRVFDPNHHTEVPFGESNGLLADVKYDRRWAYIRRPTIIVGGELTMEQLELRLNTSTNVNEAPVQMKSNCGTLVIDDFGRQRISTDELLNRWIVPLEKRFDYLNLSSGKKTQVPFDQLVIFSTNLQPKDLVDDAFLRRIPYKIEVENPSEAAFRKLFEIMCPRSGLPYKPDVIDYLINTHYKPTGRPFRNCHPRDLLLQVRNYCLYHDEPLDLCNDYVDFACENYFSIM
ncbi:MAG: AAA family ATPase [Planctomycetales bacterium]|nr:AAA family ATPase [Planctomycetales bacterium]